MNIARIVYPSLDHSFHVDVIGDVNAWLHLPIEADDDAITAIARTWTGLPPERQLYVELSWDLWDGEWPQFEIAIEDGVKLGLGANKYEQGAAFTVFRSLQMFQLFAGVLGGERMGVDVMRVFRVGGNLDLYTTAFASVYTSQMWNPRRQKIDVIVTDGPRSDVETLARQYGIGRIGYQGQVVALDVADAQAKS